MHAVPLRLMRPDMVLAQDVRTGRPNEVPLLRAGTRLQPGYAERLEALGVRVVWVQDELSEGVMPLPPLSDTDRASFVGRVSSSFSRVGEAVRDGGTAIPAEAIDVVTNVAAELCEMLANLPEGALALQDLATADAYTHRHSLQVAVVGMLLARRRWNRRGWRDWNGRVRFDDIDTRLSRLGMGLLLHDIGKLAVPTEILHKPGRLTEPEMAVMRTHPTVGADLLRGANPSPLVLAVVRDHHERIDGSGYPRGRSDPHEMAQVCAVADVFDAMTSERPYKAPSPPHVALQVLDEQGLRGAFSEEMLKDFRAVCPPFPLGTTVELADRPAAVVVELRDEDLWQPVVRYRRRMAGGGETIVEERWDLSHMDAWRQNRPTVTQPAERPVQHLVHRWDGVAAAV